MAELVGTSSAERTLDQRELASLRPARENAPRPRKPRVLREVTNGIVCFCGERFGEHQALEFMLHLRAEVGETLDWAARNKQMYREQNKRRYQRHKERLQAAAREHWREYSQRPEVKERRRLAAQVRNQRPEVKEAARLRRAKKAADPAWRKQENAKKREREQRRRERDPEWYQRRLEHERALDRARRARKKAQREAAAS